MFVGHLGAGLAAKGVKRDINLGTLFAAAMLLDIVLWAFVLTGWERATIPTDFAQRHYLRFDFPYSHSALAALAWAAALTALWSALNRRRALVLSASLVVALTVLSHWLLDAAVHEPELTLWGDVSPRVGGALWDHQPLGGALEAAIATIGLAIFLVRAKIETWRKVVITALTALVAGLTYVGSTAAAPPPNVEAPAITSLVAIVIVILIAAWADHRAVA